MALGSERARLALALALALLLGAPLGASQIRAFDAPTGLTLVAQGGGRYTMVWDPIYRDDLLGYSVWLRKPGDREFVRLSIPVRVGKEIKKEPLTSEAKVVLAFGRDRKDLEMTVVASYEDGDSARARVLRSAAARRDDADVGAPAALSATSTVAERYAALASAGAPAPGGEAPWDKEKERAARPLILPKGEWGSVLGVGFSYQRYITSGTDVTTSGQTVGWQRTDVRTVALVPLTMRLGLLTGLEAWVRATYAAEDYYIADYKYGGTDYNDNFYYTLGANGSITTLSNPTTSGLGDVMLGLKAQPVADQPLLVSVQASLPTGVSRFKSMLDFLNGAGTPAGNGEGVLRLKLGIDWGYVGLRPGLSFHAAYEPSATESISEAFPGASTMLTQAAIHGSVTELGGAYTFPWTVSGREGALAVGIQGSSIEADRWTINGTDIGGGFSGYKLGEIAGLSGLEFRRDDQLELSLNAYQDLPRGFETRGKLAYTMDSLGDSLGISGQFLY